MDIDRGANLMQTDGKDFAKVDSVNRAKQTIDIYKSRGKAEIHPTALIQFEYIRVEEIEDSLMRLGQSAAKAGLQALSPLAAVDLLLGARRASTAERSAKRLTSPKWTSPYAPFAISTAPFWQSRDHPARERPIPAPISLLRWWLMENASA